MTKKLKNTSHKEFPTKIQKPKTKDLKKDKHNGSVKSEDKKYYDFLNNMPVGYFEVDLKGNYTFVNKIIQELHQRSQEELLGMSYKDYRTEDESKRIFKIYNEVYRTGKPAEIKDNRIIRKDGSICYISNRISLLRDESGIPVGFSGFTLDTTDKKQSENELKKSKEKYKTILQTMEDEYYEVDLEGKLIFCNDALCRHSGYSYDELMGIRYQDYTLPEESDRIFKAFNSVFESGKVAKISDVEVIKKDGSTRIIDISISPLKDTTRSFIGFRGISQDVTQKRKSKKAIQEGEEQYRNILETMEEGYFELDLSGNFTLVNEAECKLHKRSHDEMVGYNLRKSFSEEVGKAVYDFYNRVYRTGEPAKMVDWKLTRGDGTSIYVETSVSLRRNHKGEPIGFRGVSRDVTERKKAMDALRESEKKYRNILENMEEGYFETDLAGNYTFVNDAMYTFHGYSKDELIGMNNREYSSYEESRRIYKIYNDVYKTGNPAKIVDYEIIRKDGAVRNMETSVSLLRNEINEPIGFSGITRDVTERMLAEKAVRKSEERYRTILETMEEGYYEVDLKGSFTFFNPAELRLHGLTADELMGLNNREFSTPETSERVYKVFNEVYRTGIPAKVIDYEIIKKNGRKITLETSASLMRDEKGNPIGFRGISRDVTDRKKAEAALKDSEEKYRLLIENANEGIFIYQYNSIKFPNPRAKAITGYSADELKKMSLDDLVHPDDQDKYNKQQRTDERRSKNTRMSMFRIRNKEDDVLWIEMSRIAIQWEGQPADLIFLRDISEQKKIEVQLLQAQKMEAIGTLAGGIAHDFNNLLMGIQGNASLVQLALGEGNPHSERLKSIEHLVSDGSELTKQLLGVARGGKYEVLPTNVNRIIEKTAALFGRTQKEISIHKVLKKDLCVVEIDRSQIEQVLLNLYVNAWHAMPDGGDLYLETKNVTLDEYYTKAYHIESGKYIRISVTDNGIGMDDETRKRVFDPFFTTKEMGRGTGLGLASAYGIIRNHRGIINVYSEIKQGTTFNIYLPVSHKKIKEEVSDKEEIRTGTETILFVDDEETIIEVGQQLLDILGYKTIMAKSGKETLSIYRNEHSNIDLVILDMIMPNMSGGDTYNKLKEINPEVKVLLSSGYSLNGQAEEILARGCEGFIQKPFNLEELSKKIREVLDE